MGHVNTLNLACYRNYLNTIYQHIKIIVSFTSQQISLKLVSQRLNCDRIGCIDALLHRYFKHPESLSGVENKLFYDASTCYWLS